MKIGSLCSGYGGLDLAVEELFGAETVWVSDVEPAANKVLAKRFPVPNIGDLKVADWGSLEPIDILTGGYPCQPFSHAGKRMGEEDPRHLWPHISVAIRELKPRFLCFENVRGHLSLGFDQVLIDMGKLGYDVDWAIVKASDVGAAHQRARLFIFGTLHEEGSKTDQKPYAVLEQDDWVLLNKKTGEREPGKKVKLPPSGHMIGGIIYADDPFSLNLETVNTLPTPTCSDTNGAGAHGTGGADLRTTVALLPTPVVNDMGEGKTPQKWEEMRARWKMEHGNGNGHGNSLAIEAQRLMPTLLPTPLSVEGTKPSNTMGLSRQKRQVYLTNAIVSVCGMDPTEEGYLPTPITTDAKYPGPADKNRVTVQLRAIADLVATPTTQESKSGPSQAFRNSPPLNAQVLMPDWGKYTQAIERAEMVTGVPVPEPTEFGPRGAKRLAASFVEWLMMLEKGWITDVEGISRAQALKMLGNGVVPPQAYAAYSFLASRWKNRKSEKV